MTKTQEPVRKTVYLEEKLVRQAEILFGEAEVESFSAFVTKAIEAYITKLVIDKNGDLLSKEIRKAIHEEINPTNTRISKGLYRYAIELDMLASNGGVSARLPIRRDHRHAEGSQQVRSADAR